MKFSTHAPFPQPPAVASAGSKHHLAVAGIRYWSLGAALLIGLSGYGCGRAGNSSTDATPTPTPTPTPVPTVAPVAVVTPTPTPEPTVEAARYSGVQQAEYIKTAQDFFLGARDAKSAPYLTAIKAFNDAGGASGKGLNSKEAITQRRALIEACRQANEQYMTFAATQADVYRAELAKTPLTPADVDGLVADFVAKGHPEDFKKLRETERDSLKTADDMMAYLEKNYGSWTLSANKPLFKKPADANAYTTLAKKYNGMVAEMQTLRAVVSAPLPTPGASPIASVSPAPGTVTGVQPAVPAVTVKPAP